MTKKEVSKETDVKHLDGVDVGLRDIIKTVWSSKSNVFIDLVLNRQNKYKTSIDVRWDGHQFVVEYLDYKLRTEDSGVSQPAILRLPVQAMTLYLAFLRFGNINRQNITDEKYIKGKNHYVVDCAIQDYFNATYYPKEDLIKRDKYMENAEEKVASLFYEETIYNVQCNYINKKIDELLKGKICHCLSDSLLEEEAISKLKISKSIKGNKCVGIELNKVNFHIGMLTKI